MYNSIYNILISLFDGVNVPSFIPEICSWFSVALTLGLVFLPFFLVVRFITLVVGIGR